MEVNLSRKEEIKKTGSRLFREKGYASTSMQDIAHAMGIKAASLYNHINSKQEILYELLQEGADRFVTGMEEVKKSSLTPVEKLENVIKQHIRIAIEHTDLMALMTVEWRHLEEEGKAKYAKSRMDYENDLKVIIQEAKKLGQLKEVDVDIAIFSILTTLQRFYAWHDRHSDCNALDLEKDMIQCLLDGIRK